MLRRVGAVGVFVAAVAMAQTAGPAAWQNDLKPISAGGLELRLCRPPVGAGWIWRNSRGNPGAGETDAGAGHRAAGSLRGDGREPVCRPSIIRESTIRDSNRFLPAAPPSPIKPRRTGEALGIKVKPEGNRRLQPVVNEFFYWLRASVLETNRVAYWWANRMVDSPRPLREKMALFWHGHFAVNEAKVRDYRKLLDQLELFQKQGTGNFRDFTGGGGAGSGDAYVPGRGRERERRGQRKFRARNHGTVHHGRGPLHRKRYSRGRARLHRLELRGSQIRREQRPA